MKWGGGGGSFESVTPLHNFTSIFYAYATFMITIFTYTNID